MSHAPPSLVSSYLRDLPQGLESYPDAQVTAVLFRRLLTDEPSILKYCAPMAWDTTAIAQLNDARLIPLTMHVAAVLALMEHRRYSAPRMRQYLREQGAAILSAGAYRLAFYVLSPVILVMGVGTRYARDFRGVTAVGQATGLKTATLTLKYPERLFIEPYVDAYNGVFEAALNAGGSRQSSSQVDSVSATQAISSFTWW